MPRGRRRIEGPITALANNRKQFEKNCRKVVDLIQKELGALTSVSKNSKPVHFGSSLRIDLQREPYERDRRWWANYAVQTGSTVNGSLEVECDVPFAAGTISDAMIEACGNAHTAELKGSKWIVTAQFQYVLWATRQPSDVQPA